MFPVGLLAEERAGLMTSDQRGEECGIQHRRFTGHPDSTANQTRQVLAGRECSGPCLFLWLWLHDRPVVSGVSETHRDKRSDQPDGRLPTIQGQE